MKYIDFIEGNESFQYSVNIQYDLYNAAKVEGYIPTQRSVELIKEYLLNTIIKGKNKSTVLIGPYGKGKSHLLLVILSVLSGLHKEQLYGLIRKIRKVDKECAELIVDITENNKFLPVVLNSNSMDLSQAFLIALRQALLKIGANNILPNTFYDSAIEVLEGWKDYKSTYERVEKLVLEQSGVTVEQFIKSLRSFNSSAYEIFKLIFKEITSGVEFNPLINSDIVKLYEEVNYILKENYNYSGMIIVFDEFSKFIEASVTYNTSKDLKILQDLAELASRSDDPQIHLICVTHKTINEYITQIPQNKVDAWRAIEGRFKEVYFNSSSQQNFELISNAIVKDEKKFNKFWNEHKLNYSTYNDGSFILFNNLYDEKEFEEIIIKGCFPLSPYVTYILPKISEKVAQNERTLFTFLSKDDKYSLLDIIKNDKKEKELITIDNLYDYFEPLLRKEVFNEKINSIWVKANTALSNVSCDKEKKIIKALAVINIIGDYKVLEPTIEKLSKTIGERKNEVDEIINNLINKSILMVRKTNSYVDFMPISGVDIEGKINSLVEVKLKNIDISKVINELVDLKYILPRSYNDEFKMVRYFKRLFMTERELTAYDEGSYLLENKKCDGIFINLITESNEERESALNWLNKISDSRIGIFISNNNLNIKRDVARYVVINDLLEDNEFLKEDLTLESQLYILLDDIVEYIKCKIENLFDFNSQDIKLYIKEKEVSSLSMVKLSDLASSICIEHYNKSPKINNELINKNNISSPILKGRNIIVNMILNNDMCSFESDGNSVECTLFRATLLNKGLVNSNIDKDLIYLFDEIKSFISSAEESERKFSELYENILTNKRGIGVRKGLVPIYLAFILSKYKNEVIIYIGGRKKKEVPLTVDIINNINDNPENYFLRIEKGTKDKDDYILGVEELFKEHRNYRVSEGQYADIVKSMQIWLQSLSKYAQSHRIDLRTYNELDKAIIKFRSALVKFDINYREFLFNDIPSIFKSNSLNECLESLISTKKYEESVDKKLRNLVKDKTIEIINKGYKGTLINAIKTWLLSVKEEKLNHLYDVTTNGVIEVLNSDINNEDILISKLAYTLTGLALEDWNDHSLEDYVREFKKVKSIIENHEIACDSSSQGQIKISFVNEEGDFTEKTFDKIEITPFGSMLLNNIEESLYEFGDSIDDNEKRNILIKVLKKFI